MAMSFWKRFIRVTANDDDTVDGGIYQPKSARTADSDPDVLEDSAFQPRRKTVKPAPEEDDVPLRRATPARRPVAADDGWGDQEEILDEDGEPAERENFRALHVEDPSQGKRAIELLQDGYVVIVDLADMDPAAVPFFQSYLMGTADALDAELRPMDDNKFLLAPAEVDLSLLFGSDESEQDGEDEA